MSKFNVGDTVKVIGKRGVPHLIAIGSICKVIESPSIYSSTVKVENVKPVAFLGKIEQHVSDCDLELVSSADKRSKAGKMPSEPDWKIVIVPDGDKTTARFYDGGKCAMSASVRRYHEDSYDVFTAADEAIKKLFGKQDKPVEKAESEKPVGYTGYAVYIGDSENPGFTVGRIYRFSHGRTLDDHHDVRPSPALDPTNFEPDQWGAKSFVKIV